MSDLMSGFTQDGAAADPGDSFESGLAAAVGKDGDSSSTAEPQAPADPAATPGEAIVSALLDSGGDVGTAVSHGYVVKEAPATEPAADRVRLSDGNVYGAAEIDSAILGAARDLEELQSYRDDSVADTVQADLSEAESDNDVAFALGWAAHQVVEGELSHEGYAELRDRALEEILPAYLGEPNDDGEYDPASVQQVGQLLDAAARQVATELHQEAMDEHVQHLLPAAAERRVQQMRASLVQLARDQGIPEQAARLGIPAKQLLDWRLKQAEALYRSDTGRELGDLWADPSVPMEVAHETMIEYDARNGAARKLYNDLDFKQRMLDSNPGFEDGLVIEGRAAPAKTLSAPSPEKIHATVEAHARRARSPQPTSIKAAFSEPSTALSQGWRDESGKAVKQTDIDGSREKWERDEKWRRDRSRY